MVVGQSPPGVGQSNQSNASLLKPSPVSLKSLPLKPIAYPHGEPMVIWDQSKVDQMIINESLQYAVIDKFSYRWPEIENLKKVIPNSVN